MIKHIATTWMLSCLLLLLISCATPNPSLMALTEPTPVPKLVGDTNGALIQYAADSNAAARKANGDKARIRQLTQPRPWWKRVGDWLRR